MTYYFMDWLRINFKYRPEIIKEYITCFLREGNDEIIIETHEPGDYVNFAFPWSNSKIPSEIWNEVNDSWYAYCKTLELYGVFENIPVNIKFGDLIEKSKKINKLNINFDIDKIE